MWKVLGFLGCLGLASATCVQADTPERVVFADVISIGVGRAEILQFPSSFEVVNVVTQGIVRATVRSDRVLTLYGEAEGETAVFVLGPNGRPMYSAKVIVTPEPGHVVRFYGRSETKDYHGFYCNEVSCGRVDKELLGSRDPASQSVTVTKPQPDGGTVSTTKSYGGR
jgi:hypothetical protein